MQQTYAFTYSCKISSIRTRNPIKSCTQKSSSHVPRCSKVLSEFREASLQMAQTHACKIFINKNSKIKSNRIESCTQNSSSHVPRCHKCSKVLSEFKQASVQMTPTYACTIHSNSKSNQILHAKFLFSHLYMQMPQVQQGVVGVQTSISADVPTNGPTCSSHRIRQRHCLPGYCRATKRHCFSIFVYLSFWS